MIVTEEEAETKRCQESYPAAETISEAGSPDRIEVEPRGFQSVFRARHAAPLYCIGSACMAWRWHNDDLSDYPPDTKGYCGKAYRP